MCTLRMYMCTLHTSVATRPLSVADIAVANMVVANMVYPLHHTRGRARTSMYMMWNVETWKLAAYCI